MATNMDAIKLGSDEIQIFTTCGLSAKNVAADVSPEIAHVRESRPVITYTQFDFCKCRDSSPVNN